MFLQINPEAGPVVVVGAGPIGARKVRTLLQHGFSVRWVTGVEISEPAAALIAAEQNSDALGVVRRDFCDSDIGDCWLVVAATGSEAVNNRIAAVGSAANCLCIRADNATGMAHMVSQRDVSGLGAVAVSTAGRAPALARTLADWLAVLLSGETLGRVVDAVAGMSGRERRVWGAATRLALEQGEAEHLQALGDRLFSDWQPGETDT